MNYAKRIDSAPVLYSCCSGHNFYFSDDLRQHEVFGKPKRIIQHVKTEERFYVTLFPDDLNTKLELNYWVELIRKPVNLKHYIWPVDVISIPTDNDTERYALVFPIRALPVFETISALLSNDMQAGWDKPWVKDFTLNLLTAWCHFDDSRYAYHEFSVENMFHQKDKYNVMFDFSFSTQRTDDLYSTRFVNKKRITPDYADSYYYVDERNSLMDLASDYYSIAVILFKLLIGRLPYQGKVMEHEPNSNEGEHKNWLKIYHRNTFFIFDEKDKTNHIGGETGFAKDDLYVDRWNELPAHVRHMFHNVFQTANVLRKTDEFIFYPPKQWYDALFGTASDIELVYRDTEIKKQKQTETIDEKIVGTEKVLEVAKMEPEISPDSQNSDEKKAHMGELANILQGKIDETPKPHRFHDVIITASSQSDKIVAIKVIREITGLGLKAAKELLENTPYPVVQGISGELAERVQSELSLVGVETKLGANSQRDENVEQKINERMQGRWQSKSDGEEI